MIRPKIYLLLTILILVIIVIKVQCYFKSIENFNTYGYTCNRCAPCAKGEGRINCGGTSSGECKQCTGQTYKSDSGNGECMPVPDNSNPTTNKQDFTCNAGYFRSGNNPDSCSPCTGETYKSDSGNGGCTPVPDNSNPTINKQDFTCDPGYFRYGTEPGECKQCTGQTYKSDSGNGECMPVPDNSNPTINKQDFTCDPGYFRSGNSCITCSPCPAGKENLSCSGIEPGECKLCTGQRYKPYRGNDECTAVPSNSKPTEDKQDFTCDPDYFKSGNNCIPCGSCGAGMERRGCSGNEPGECMLCTGQRYKPYRGNDECTAVPSNSNPTTNKQDFTCNAGYFRSGDSCDACPSCTGWYTGSCGGTTNTKLCYSCPACADNEYSTGSCGGTTNTKRCHTCPCGQIPNSSKTGCQWDNNFYLFMEYNQTGYCSRITGSVTSNDGWNRNASSFLIPPNKTLAIYKNTNCSGSCKSFTAPAGSFGHWNLSGNDALFNNAVLSIKPDKGCKQSWQYYYPHLFSGCNY